MLYKGYVHDRDKVLKLTSHTSVYWLCKIQLIIFFFSQTVLFENNIKFNCIHKFNIIKKFIFIFCKNFMNNTIMFVIEQKMIRKNKIILKLYLIFYN